MEPETVKKRMIDFVESMRKRDVTTKPKITATDFGKLHGIDTASSSSSSMSDTLASAYGVFTPLATAAFTTTVHIDDLIVIKPSIKHIGKPKAKS